MALVLLKTGIHHPEPGTIDPTTGEAAVPTVDPNQMATAQKLLLFWRKPAVCLLLFPSHLLFFCYL